MQRPRHLMLAVLSGLLSPTALLITAGAQPPTLPSLLGAAASYVATYEEQAAAIVFEETYSQRVSRMTPPPPSARHVEAPAPAAVERLLRSEVAVVNSADLGWIGFRDVFEVNGKPVSDRQDRLLKLFAQPLTPNAIVRARAVADESARFNLGSVQRDLNYPTFALMFLREANQRRSTFTREGSARVDGAVTWILRFQEVERPTLIASRTGNSRVSDVVTSGRFWVEPDSGRVRRSQIRVEEEFATGTFDVTYGAAPDLQVLVPVSMREDISVRAGDPRLERGLTGAGEIRPVEMIRGEARYSNVRRFQVEVKADVLVPGAVK